MLKPDVEELLQLASIYDIHLFILILNNIRTVKVKKSSHNGRQQILDLIKYLKYIYGKPVIALTGYDFDDPDFETHVISAGADFYFPLPFETEDFHKAVNHCLERQTGLNHK
ncbi:hypothetical protein ACFL4L_02720 [bacterium]